MRHLGAYDQIPEAFERLGRIAGPAGMFQGPSSAMVALYHDDPATTPAEHLRSDAGLTVPPNAPLPEGLTERSVPAGTYACAVHVGPYDGLPAVWQRLTRGWLPASGRRLVEGAPSYELYLNDPTSTPKTALRTEIRIPVS